MLAESFGFALRFTLGSLRVIAVLILFLPGTLGFIVGQIVAPWTAEIDGLEPLDRLDGELHPGHPTLFDLLLGTGMLVLSPVLFAITLLAIVAMIAFPENRERRE